MIRKSTRRHLAAVRNSKTLHKSVREYYLNQLLIFIMSIVQGVKGDTATQAKSLVRTFLANLPRRLALNGGWMDPSESGTTELQLFY